MGALLFHILGDNLSLRQSQYQLLNLYNMLGLMRLLLHLSVVFSMPDIAVQEDKTEKVAVLHRVKLFFDSSKLTIHLIHNIIFTVLYLSLFKYISHSFG